MAVGYGSNYLPNLLVLNEAPEKPVGLLWTTGTDSGKCQRKNILEPHSKGILEEGEPVALGFSATFSIYSKVELGTTQKPRASAQGRPRKL